MTCASPFRKLVQSIEKEGGDKNICVDPQTSGRDSDEMSPPISPKAERHRRHVHPCLEKVKPADVGLPKSRYAEHQNKEASADED